MQRYCEAIPGPKMVNLIEYGKTPLLPLDRLEAIGYKIAVYPLSLLNTSIKAMTSALAQIKQGGTTGEILDFEALTAAVGFPQYYTEERRYRNS